MLWKQHKVDDSHNDMPLIYYIEGHSLHFGRPEFALITGMRFGTISFGLYTSGELKFRNRGFPHKVGLTVTNLDVIGVIEDEEMFGKLCDEDSIRLCLLLALEVIFMGRLMTCPVDDTLFGLVENLEAWNVFPWGSMTNENAENYVLFQVNNDGVFMKYPLRYDHGKILTLKLAKANKMSYSKMLDLLSYKLECHIWAIFYYTLRCGLERGLTIIESDSDMNKMYDIGETYRLIELYIAHILKNLSEYYYKNLTFDATDEDVFCKVKTHEKRIQDAGSMSPEELVAWAEEEADSPYLRTPPLKPRRKGFEVPCKNLLGYFLHCDSVADEFVLHDNWEYEGLSLDGYIDVGCLVHAVIWLRKGRGKRVSVGAKNGRMGSLIALNEHEGDDDPQVMTQVSLTVGSSNSDVKVVD
ncbi:phospholipase-like protein [Tanacetum coccineum]|uniref:Phospholipase-like protein n=1 Tax=Tanacetum coccineum TaxID=301880 RepID=A0ABQ4YNP8_9ASTR